jgi:hypothetical protein
MRNFLAAAIVLILEALSLWALSSAHFDDWGFLIPFLLIVIVFSICMYVFGRNAYRQGYSLGGGFFVAISVLSIIFSVAYFIIGATFLTHLM